MDIGKLYTEIPVIGIPTMPSKDYEYTENFAYKHFSWEHNINFIHYAGSFAAAIRYDLPEDELY